MTMIEVRRMAAGLLLMVFVTALMAGCAPRREALSPEAGLRGTLWRAVELDGSRVEFLPGQKLDLSLVLYRSGTFRGTTGCGNVTGSYTLKGSRIAFSAIVPEGRPCRPAIARREAAYLKALGRASSFGNRGGSLSVMDRNGSVLLRFIAVKGRR